MAEPVFVITLGEILSGMGTTTLVARLRNHGSGLSNFKQVLKLQRLNSSGVEGVCLVFEADAVNAAP